MKKLLFTFLLLGIFLFLINTASALLLEGSGLNSSHDLNLGASIDGTPTIPQSSYSNEFAIASTTGDGTFFGEIPLSDIPVYDSGGDLFFNFVLDVQEPGGTQSISIDDIIVSITGVGIYWDYDQATYGSILINSTSNTTYTPNSNGSDMELLVPVSLFYGSGLTGSNVLRLTWSQTMAGDGKEEWVTVGEGFFDPDQPVEPIPEPATMLLLGSGLLGLAGVGRKKFFKK